MPYRHSEQVDSGNDDRHHVQSAALLDAVLARGDIAAFLEAMNILVKAQGFATVAHRTGLNRTWLYKAIAPTQNPGIHTIVLLLSPLGLRLCVKRRQKAPMNIDVNSSESIMRPQTESLLAGRNERANLKGAGCQYCEAHNLARPVNTGKFSVLEESTRSIRRQVLRSEVMPCFKCPTIRPV